MKSSAEPTFSTSSLSLVQVAPSSRDRSMLTPPATPRSVHWIVLLRPIRNVVSANRSAQSQGGACLTPRVIVCAEASRFEPSAALALAIARADEIAFAGRPDRHNDECFRSRRQAPQIAGGDRSDEHSPCDGRADSSARSPAAFRSRASPTDARARDSRP